MKNTIQFSNGTVISIPKLLFTVSFIISTFAIVLSGIVSLTYDIQFFSERTSYLMIISAASLCFLLYKKQIEKVNYDQL